jgi:hypothetical protein
MSKSIDGMRPSNAQKSNKGHKRTIAGLVVIWFLILCVIGSVGFSSYMVYFGMDDSTAKILILPQVAAAVITLIALPAVAAHKLLSNK